MRFLILRLVLTVLTIVVSHPALAQSNPPAPAAGYSAAIRFEDIAAKAGVHFTTENSPTGKKNQKETMVAGVALIDFDGDGWQDIYLVNGAAIPSLQKESPAYW